MQYNGGPTKTHALLAGSPAINAGTAVGAPTVDQRSGARDATPDIGAYEFGAAVNAAPTVVSANTIAYTENAPATALNATAALTMNRLCETNDVFMPPY